MTPDMQSAQDLLSVVETQRNNLANQLAHTHAELMAARRKIAELEAAARAASTLAAKVPAPETNPQTQDQKSNGYLGHLEASAPIG